MGDGVKILYLGGVNALGFLLYALRRRRRGGEGRMGVWLVLTALLGGTGGLLLAMGRWDPRAEKENMMSRVFLLCTLVCQSALFYLFRLNSQTALRFAPVEFFSAHRLLGLWLLGLNLLTLAAFGLDKARAVQHKRRIPIVTLLTMAALGGSVGGIGGMLLFRHKIRKSYFALGLPLILLTQSLLLFLAMQL